MALSEDLFNSYMENDELIPSLQNKAVAITGTTTGLGHSLARCAIVKNAALVLLLNRKSERSEKSEQDLQKYLVMAVRQLSKLSNVISNHLIV